MGYCLGTGKGIRVHNHHAKVNLKLHLLRVGISRPSTSEFVAEVKLGHVQLFTCVKWQVKLCVSYGR